MINGSDHRNQRISLDFLAYKNLKDKDVKNARKKIDNILNARKSKVLNPITQVYNEPL